MESATQTTHSQPYLTVSGFHDGRAERLRLQTCRHGSSTKLYQGTARELGNLVLPKKWKDSPPNFPVPKWTSKLKGSKIVTFYVNHFVTDQPFFSIIFSASTFATFFWADGVSGLLQLRSRLHSTWPRWECEQKHIHRGSEEFFLVSNPLWILKVRRRSEVDPATNSGSFYGWFFASHRTCFFLRATIFHWEPTSRPSGWTDTSLRWWGLWWWSAWWWSSWCHLWGNLRGVGDGNTGKPTNFCPLKINGWNLEDVFPFWGHVT